MLVPECKEVTYNLKVNYFPSTLCAHIYEHALSESGPSLMLKRSIEEASNFTKSICAAYKHKK